MKGTSDKSVSRAKHVLSIVEGSAKGRQAEFKKRLNGRGLCELSALGAINFLKLVLFNNSTEQIYECTTDDRTD